MRSVALSAFSKWLLSVLFKESEPNEVPMGSSPPSTISGALEFATLYDIIEPNESPPGSNFPFPTDIMDTEPNDRPEGSRAPVMRAAASWSKLCRFSRGGAEAEADAGADADAVPAGGWCWKACW